MRNLIVLGCCLMLIASLLWWALQPIPTPEQTPIQIENSDPLSEEERQELQKTLDLLNGMEKDLRTLDEELKLLEEMIKLQEEMNRLKDEEWKLRNGKMWSA